MAVIQGLNSIDGQNSYFIRLKDKPTHFLHYQGDNPANDEEVMYQVKQGVSGAAVWKKDKAEQLIKESSAVNLEIVKVSDVIPNDGTFN